MAEFCLKCWNRINGTEYDERKYILSEYLDLCEGCGEWKPVIVAERRFYYMHKLRYFILPFKIICGVICVLCRLLILPYLIFKYYKAKKKC